MRRTIRRVLLLVVLTVMLVGGALPHAGATSRGQWHPSESDPCLYYWIGNVTTGAACVETTGVIHFYAAQGGQWVYIFSGFPLADGSAWISTGGEWVYAPAGTQPEGITSTIVGGGGGSPGDLTVHDLITNVTRDTCLSGEDPYRDACS